MAGSYPVAADSSLAELIAEVWLDSDAKDVAPIARPGVRKGSGIQPEPASSSCALSAISPFFRCSMSWAAVSPLASRTAWTMRALVTRPR